MKKKECTRCGRMLLLTEYYFTSCGGRRYRHSRCKRCSKEVKREHYNKHYK